MFQVSPAKFAWLVHSVGVALASLSPISSWVGLQIGYTKAVLDALGVSPPLDGFLVVLRSLPFRFFPLFYLLLIVIVLVSGRDFGPMANAESSSGSGSDASGSGPSPQSPAADSQLAADPSGEQGGGGEGITPKAGTPLRSRNALVPFAAVILVTFAGMILDGISKIEANGNEVTAGLVTRGFRGSFFLPGTTPYLFIPLAPRLAVLPTECVPCHVSREPFGHLYIMPQVSIIIPSRTGVDGRPARMPWLAF